MVGLGDLGYRAARVALERDSLWMTMSNGARTSARNAYSSTNTVNLMMPSIPIPTKNGLAAPIALDPASQRFTWLLGS